MNLVLIIVVSVNWVETEYTGNEGSTLIVCAEHPEETERPFSVNIAAPNTVEGMLYSHCVMSSNLSLTHTHTLPLFLPRHYTDDN